MFFQSLTAQSDIAVIPLPKKYVSVEEYFTLGTTQSITFDSSLRSEAYFLQKRLFELKGITTIFESDADKATIVLTRSNICAYTQQYS